MTKLYFYCPFSSQPSGGIGVLLKHALIMRRQGYDVAVVYEPVACESADSGQPVVYDFEFDWLEFSIQGLETIALGSGQVTTRKGRRLTLCSSLNFLPSDIFVIPEGMAGIIRNSKGLPCRRVVLAQSWSYIFPFLNNGETWQDFGIRKVLTIGSNIKNFLDRYMPGLDVSVVNYSISREIFSPAASRKKQIAYSCRDAAMEFKTLQAIRIFYALNPDKKDYQFVRLNDLSRREFAHRLSESAFYVFNDDISGVPTAPLEAMACRIPTIGWSTYGSAEYATKENGFWIPDGDIIGLGEKLSEVVRTYDDDSLNLSDMYEAFDDTLEGYTEGKEAELVHRFYSSV